MANLSVLNHRAAHQSSAVSFVSSSSFSLDGMYSILFRLFSSSLIRHGKPNLSIFVLFFFFFLATWSVYSNSFVDAPRHCLPPFIRRYLSAVRRGLAIFMTFSSIISLPPSTHPFSQIRYRHSINITNNGEKPGEYLGERNRRKSIEFRWKCQRENVELFCLHSEYHYCCRLKIYRGYRGTQTEK